MKRAVIDPPLKARFEDVFEVISKQPNQRTPELISTGGVLFLAESKHARDGRRFISLPHGNRIYEDDWGFRSNGMGKDGQRIGQYAIPIDNWANSLSVQSV